MTTQNNTPFDSRESYKAWVKEWKDGYAVISQQIRETKSETKKLQKAGDLSACSMQARRQQLRTMARRMIIERRDAKDLAQAQYLESRALEQEAA